MPESDLNPYRGSDGSPQMRRSVTAVLDILGYQEYIKRAFSRGQGQEELARLRSALDTAYNFLKAQSKEVWVDGKLRFQVRAFTDNLIIGHPATEADYGLGVLMMMIDYVAYIQADLAQKGYFIRGGIAVGDLYIDDDIIFGPALLEAYEAEHQVAVFPRVVLCDSAKELYEGRHSGFVVPDLLRDSDGQVFVDYLDATVMIAPDDAGPFEQILDGHKAAITEKLQEFRVLPRVWAKYQWLGFYHNAFCERHAKMIDGEKAIPTELLTSRPSQWKA